MKYDVWSMDKLPVCLGQKGGAEAKPLSDRDRANPGFISFNA
jgi:hypothetical protein